MNIPILLAAIATIESACDDFARGRAGEVSRYQISQRNWRHYERELGHKANPVSPRDAAAVARMVIDDIRCLLPEPLRDDVRAVAAAWNYGPRRVKATWKKHRIPAWMGHLPASVHEYANRVEREYENLCAKHIVWPPPSKPGRGSKGAR